MTGHNKIKKVKESQAVNDVSDKKVPDFQVVCRDCGQQFPRTFMPFCDQCGGLTEAFYNMKTVKLYESDNPYRRFQDLLPVINKALLPEDARFTPTIHAEKLGAFLGLPRLYLKDETNLPTGTTKDRMAAVALSYLSECGIQNFCTSSTGNSSTAYARALSRFPDFTMYLFTAADFYPRVNCTSNPHIIHYVLRDASFTEAFEYAGSFARQNGFVSERGFFNLSRREGLKLSCLEAIDQVPEPIDWYVQAVSSAMGVYGVYKGAKEMQQLGLIPHLPHLLCVQQETCAPMVHAWEDGSDVIRPEHIVEKPTGIAQAILRGDPTRAYPFVRSIVIESEGILTAVSESQIREAKQLVEDMEGLSPCFSASTAVAGLIKLVREKKFPTNDTILLNLTGSDREPEEEGVAQNVRWLVRSEDGWTPEQPDQEDHLIY